MLEMKQRLLDNLRLGLRMENQIENQEEINGNWSYMGGLCRIETKVYK